MKALKHSQATFLIENLKLQGNFHSGIDEHTCTCSLYLINFHTALFQSYHYALPHLPHAEGCAYYMTRFDAYNVRVLILAKKKNSSLSTNIVLITIYATVVLLEHTM